MGVMPQNSRRALDAVDGAILRLLQDDGRMTTAELARSIHMSPTATADRLRSLVDEGVIRGFRAIVDPVALGYPVSAFIRLSRRGSMERFQEFLERTPAIRESHHVTGEDCCLLRILSPSMQELEELAIALTAFGHVTTNLVFSTQVLDRPLVPADSARGGEDMAAHGNADRSHQRRIDRDGPPRSDTRRPAIT